MKPHQRTSRDFPVEPNPALVKKCAEIKQQLHRERSNHLLLRHDLGRQFDEILSDEDEFGDAPRALRHLATQLQIDESRIADHARVYRAFSRKQIEQLLDRSVKDDFQLSFSHLVALANVKGKAKRQKLIERVFDEKLSANQLHEEVFAEIGPRRKPGAGRKPNRPTSPMAGFVQMAKATETLRNKITTVWADVLLESHQAPADKLDEAFQKQAAGSKQNWLETRQLIDGMLAYYDRLEERFERVNKHQAGKLEPEDQADDVIDLDEPAMPKIRTADDGPVDTADDNVSLDDADDDPFGPDPEDLDNDDNDIVEPEDEDPFGPDPDDFDDDDDDDGWDY